MRHLFAALAVCTMLAGPATAQTPPAGVVEATLLPGWKLADGTRIAGLRLRLAPGWKTYWRLPGEAGIPPVFDWAGSENLKALRIHWPHPSVFEDYGVQTIGYRDEVILPIELSPADAGRPVALRGQAAIGVCKDVCLPMDMTFSATLDAADADGAAAASIRAALATVPTGTPLRDATACRVTPIADGLRLTAEIMVDTQGGTEHVFLETGRDDIWVSTPEVSRRGGTLVATADLVPPDARPFAFDRSAVRVTVLGRDGSVDLEGCSAG